MDKIEAIHALEKTSPLPRHVWREAMELWLAVAESTDIKLSPILFPTEVRQVIIQQNAIGWHQIFS
jgi:hypothetical protein